MAYAIDSDSLPFELQSFVYEPLEQGIAPASVPAFVLMQLVGGAFGAALVLLLHPSPQEA